MFEFVSCENFGKTTLPVEVKEPKVEAALLGEAIQNVSRVDSLTL